MYYLMAGDELITGVHQANRRHTQSLELTRDGPRPHVIYHLPRFSLTVLENFRAKYT